MLPCYKAKITKTQKKFEESLLKLMETKKFEAITVNDITELADVNRSTFYRHYLDKYELLEKIAILSIVGINISEVKESFHNRIKELIEQATDTGLENTEIYRRYKEIESYLNR